MSSVRAQPDGAQLRVLKVRTHKSMQEKGAGKYFNEPHSIENSMFVHKREQVDNRVPLAFFSSRIFRCGLYYLFQMAYQSRPANETVSERFLTIITHNALS